MASGMVPVINAEPPGHFTCDRCAVSCGTARAWKKHESSDKHRRAFGLDPKPRTTCPRCQKGFAQPAGVERHLQLRQCLAEGIPPTLVANEGAESSKRARPTSDLNEDGGALSNPHRPKVAKVTQCDSSHGSQQLQLPQTPSSLDFSNTPASKGLYPERDIIADASNSDLHSGTSEECTWMVIGDDVFDEAEILAMIDSYMEETSANAVPTLAEMDNIPPDYDECPPLVDSASGSSESLDDTCSLINRMSLSPLHPRRDLVSKVDMEGSDTSRRARLRINKRNFGQRCPFCTQPMAGSRNQILNHLSSHLEELKNKRLCSHCGISFLHKSDRGHRLRTTNVDTVDSPSPQVLQCVACLAAATDENGDLSANLQTRNPEVVVREWTALQLRRYRIAPSASLLPALEAKARVLPLKLRQSTCSFRSITRSLNERFSEVSLPCSFLSEPHDVKPGTSLEDHHLQMAPTTTSFRSRVSVRPQSKRRQFLGNALLHAASLGAHHMVSILLRLGAEIEFKNTTSSSLEETPLLAAARAGHLTIIALLLDRGAAPNAQNAHLMTALHLLCKRVQHRFRRIDDDYKAMALLLKHGADPSPIDRAGSTVFHYCISSGSVEMLKLLLDHPCAPSVLNDFGRLLLQQACQRDETMMAKLLLEAGLPRAHLRTWGLGDSEFELGQPLFTASIYGSVDTAKLLLSYGASADSVGLRGNALGAAAAKNHKLMIELLLGQGADPLDSRCWKSQNAFYAAAHSGSGDALKSLLSQCTEELARKRALISTFKGLWSRYKVDVGIHNILELHIDELGQSVNDIQDSILNRSRSRIGYDMLRFCSRYALFKCETLTLIFASLGEHERLDVIELLTHTSWSCGDYAHGLDCLVRLLVNLEKSGHSETHAIERGLATPRNNPLARKFPFQHVLDQVIERGSPELAHKLLRSKPDITGCYLKEFTVHSAAADECTPSSRRGLWIWH